jgi:hypothetical protein
MMTAAEAEVYEEQEDAAQLKLLNDEKLQKFSHVMAKQRDEWIRARRASGVDRRWSEDEDQYNAKDSANKRASEMMASVEQGFPVTTHQGVAHRSTVFIGLTRQKTNAAEARLADILLPTDDRNWAIQPTPDPLMSKLTDDENAAVDPRTGQPLMTSEGQPLKKKDMARALMEIAKEKARAMQDAIDDQLTECDYNGEQRKAIHFAAMLGTGVMKGPVVTNTTRRAWRPYTDATGQSVQVIEFVDVESPASFAVDPRNVFPDPGCGDDVHNGRGIYERRQVTARQIRDMAKQPGYLEDQLRKVLEEGPKPSLVYNVDQDVENEDSSRSTYELWEYWGEVEQEDLETMGVDVGDRDILKASTACVVMINNTVVKAYINPLETDELPYDFFVWEKVSNSVWGYGIPYLMRAQQRVLNAAWRQMMDNAGVSSGPQIVFRPDLIQPSDQTMQLTSRKLWYATEGTDDVRKAFTTFEFNSHQAELSNIIKMATELADAETAVPVIAQGEQGNAPDTVGGMQLLMTSANVVLKRLVKQYDDQLTKPHISRYYDYNMLYNEDDTIKGDFAVDARGTSALVVQDIQNQAIMNLLAAATNPIYGLYLDPQKLFERALKAQHIDPAEVFKSEQEIAQLKEQMAQMAAQGEQKDPRIAAAEIRAQTELQKVQVQNEGDLAELEARLQIAQTNLNMRIQEMTMQREIEMLKMSNTQNISLEKIKAQLADTAIRERGKKELFAAEQRLKLEVGSGI